MLGALQGFWVIVGIAALGYGCARRGVVDESAQQVLAQVAFFVASPCLLLGVLGHAPMAALLGRPLLVAAGSAAIATCAYLALARRWTNGLGETVIGSMASAYVNAANLGIPVAVYVLGDAALVVPTLLLQLCLLTPLAMTLMDLDALGRRPSPGDLARGVLRNPLTLAALTGTVLSLLGWYPPPAVMRPVEVMGQMAVPAMLFAFGVSLHEGGRPAATGLRAHLAWITTCKLVVQPLAALGLALASGLRGRQALAAVVIAALPAAQNVFTHAVRYERATLLARDAVLVTTLGSAPLVLLLAVLPL